MTVQDTVFNQRLIKAITYATDANDFCKHLIFSILNVCGAKSAAILRLGATESMTMVGSYGETISIQEESWVSSEAAWAKAIRENQNVLLPSVFENQSHFAIPLFQNGLVAGVLALICGTEMETCFITNEDDINSLKLAAEYYLYDYHAGSPRSGRSRVQASVVPTSLTSRQVVILKWIKTGRTYSSISREMHISESLVKQEAVRLFRYFGVDNRVAVIEKAQQAGFFEDQNPGGAVNA